MNATLKRWIKLLSVAGPLGGNCLTSPCQGCSSAAAQEPVRPVAASQPAIQAPPQDATVAATVNGEVIRLDRIDHIIRRRPLFKTPLSAAQAKALRQDVLDSFIDEVLFRQFLRQNCAKIEEPEIDKHLAGLKEALRRQGKLLPDYLREIGQSEAEIRDSISSMLQYTAYVDQRANEPELKKFFAANHDYFNNVQVKISHIVVRLSPTALPGEKTAALEKLTKVRDEILSGHISFADAARKHSVCASAIKGGDLGFITRRDSLVGDSVAELAFSMKPQHLGGPVESDQGYHLVMVTDRTNGAPATFEKVIDWVRETYAEELRQRIIQDLRKRATIQTNLPD